MSKQRCATGRSALAPWALPLVVGFSLLAGCGDDSGGDDTGVALVPPGALPPGVTPPAVPPATPPVPGTTPPAATPPAATPPATPPVPGTTPPAGTAGNGGTPPATTPPATGAALALTSTVVMEGAALPSMHRCTGPSPALAWTGGPAGTMSYAIVFKDITPGFSQDFLHWVIYDIPATETGLPGAVPIGAMPAMPAGAKQAAIWNDALGYNGPCAPFGMNTYVFTLHAIDVATLPSGDVEAMIDAHSLDSATLMITSMP